MPLHEVRMSPEEVRSFRTNLKPTRAEIVEVRACLQHLIAHPEEGEDVPISAYQGRPHCKIFECGRFLIIYSIDENKSMLYVMTILSSADY